MFYGSGLISPLYHRFLAHLTEGHESLCHGAVSVVRPDQFQQNLVGNMLGRWGLNSVQVKGLTAFGAQEGAK